jgi:hypothetical protein
MKVIIFIMSDHWGEPGVDGRIILNGSSGSGMWQYGLD